MKNHLFLNVIGLTDFTKGLIKKLFQSHVRDTARFDKTSSGVRRAKLSGNTFALHITTGGEESGSRNASHRPFLSPIQINFLFLERWYV